VVSLLGAEGITSLLVEGGAVVNWAFLRSRLVDKLTLFFTPRIFGPVGAVPWLDGMSGLPSGDALHLSQLQLQRHGEDFSVDAYLRDPYRVLGPQG
jgi:diaminohydroxyphosphoribosylaminopyrimidine deaminase/5-amino-6-(5-phosphoribosylamino)uracil reductase